MLRYECDFCKRLKGNGEQWILGFAAEQIGITAARREVTIVSQWDEARAVEPLAVHFCCDQCRQNYMQSIFGEEPVSAEVVETVAVLPAKREVRESPGRTVETRVVRRNRRPRKTNTRGRSAA